jgi:hypothetical protein
MIKRGCDFSLFLSSDYQQHRQRIRSTYHSVLRGLKSLLKLEVIGFSTKILDINNYNIKIISH